MSFGHKWDEQFMLLAHHVADWSKERGRQVGAVIVGPDKEIRSTGFNGFPRGIDDDVESRHSRETREKYFWSVHAEMNAICNAARMGTPLKGCTIYVPWFPCGGCAKAIIQSGITFLVAYEPDYSEERWGPEFLKVTDMLKEAGVQVHFIDKLKELNDQLSS